MALQVNTSVDPRTLVADPNAKNPRGDVLGVPEDYVAPVWITGQGPARRHGYPEQNLHGPMAADDPRGRPFAPRPTEPGPHAKYRTADAYNPASTPDKVPELQQKLIDAGLLDPTAAGYTPGLWGALEVEAWSKVLAQANIYGTSADEMVDYIVAHPSANLDAIKQVTLTSPIDASAVFDNVVKEAIGHKVTDADRSKFIAAWTKYETQILTGNAAASAAYSQNQAAQPGPLTDPASLSNFAQQYVDTNFAGEEAGQGYSRGLDLIGNLISGSASAGSGN